MKHLLLAKLRPLAWLVCLVLFSFGCEKDIDFTQHLNENNSIKKGEEYQFTYKFCWAAAEKNNVSNIPGTYVLKNLITGEMKTYSSAEIETECHQKASEAIKYKNQIHNTKK